MNMAPSAATTRTPEQPPTRTGRLSFRIVFWPWSRGRRLTARISLILDSEADCDCERTDLLRFAHLLGDLHPGERIADADAHADQPLELAGETREVRGAARQDDLADTERTGLVLVVLERGDELARERLNRPADRLARPLRLIGRQAVRNHLIRQRKSTLRTLDLRRSGVEDACNGDVQRRAAPVEHACE